MIPLPLPPVRAAFPPAPPAAPAPAPARGAVARAAPRPERPPPCLQRLALRQLPALALGGVLVALLWARLGEVDAGGVAAMLARVGAEQWAAALGLAALSFWAAGRYDAQVHGWLGTGVRPPEAGRAGLPAIALGQTAGFGLLTGTLVRLRMLPGLGLAGALRVTLAVTALFLLGLGTVAAAALALAPPPGLGAAAPLGWGGLALIGCGVCAAFLWPRPLLLGRRIGLPPLPLLARLTVLSAIDTIAAALCLWMLLPPSAAPELSAFVTAFLLAFGAGLVSGAPGGMGAFELVLLALLPEVPADPLLAGVVAWRAVYHALPAVLALGLIARGPGPRAGAAGPVPAPDAAGIERLLAAAPRAEAGLLRQGETRLLAAGRGQALVLPTAQALVALGDPLGGAGPGEVRTALLAAARAEGRAALLYKTGGRAAAAARRAGWTVVPVAREGWVIPAAFSDAGAERRQLRRKLRRAVAAGVLISAARPGSLPAAEMAAVARVWAEARGGERGLTMGRYAPAYVAAQAVYLARAGGRLVAFLTLHRAGREWTLDLMRALPEAPEGTMHALLARAIADAAAAGCPRLSLAALPHPAVEAAFARLPRALRPAALSEGLGQFKRAFAPRWETLYAAAPGPMALALAAADLARMVARPPPLPGTPSPRAGRPAGEGLLHPQREPTSSPS